MAKPKEAPIPKPPSREDVAARLMAQRIQDAERLAREYEAGLDPRERCGA